MPFMKFGKKKAAEEDDIDAPEESGLLMSTKGKQPDVAGEPAPEPAPPESADELDSGTPQDQPTVVVTPGGGEDEEVVDPLSEATPADPTAVAEESAEAPADAGGKKEADAADLMSAFQDDESYSDIADLVKSVEDVAASALLEELREIRLMLPPEALGQEENVA